MREALPSLRAFARSLTRGQPAADDLVRKACERALAAPGGYSLGTGLEPWLFGFMRNGFIDDSRARRPLAPLGDLSDLGLVGADGRQALQDRLYLEAVNRVMDHLPQEQREVMLLVCVAGLGYCDAAKALGVSTTTLTNRLRLGRIALMQLMDDVAAELAKAAHEAAARDL